MATSLEAGHCHTSLRHAGSTELRRLIQYTVQGYQTITVTPKLRSINASVPRPTSQVSGCLAPLTSRPCHFSSHPIEGSVALPALPSSARFLISLQYSNFLHSPSAASIDFNKLFILRSSASLSGLPFLSCSLRWSLAASNRSMSVERSWRREFWKSNMDMMTGICNS